MIRRPPRSTRTDTLFPYTTLFRSDERLIAVFGSSAAFTGNQRVPQNLQLAFGSLKQTQPGSDNFAGRAVPAAVYLACDELIEMITQADARVPGHGASFVCTKFWYKAPHMSISP